MNKNTFNSLDYISQISCINKSLSEGDSLLKICKEIGMQPSAINEQFKTFGYEFDSTNKQYIKISSTNSLNPNSLTIDKYTFDDMYLKLNEVYEWYKSQNNSSECKDLNIDEFEGNPVSRSYKIYPDIQIEFKEFCDKHKQYKVQDLVSQAFKNFLDLYS